MKTSGKYYKELVLILLITASLLIIPLSAMLFTNEVNWTASDFFAAWIMLSIAGLAYRSMTRRMERIEYKAAAAIAAAASLFLLWSNLAVGIIGNEDNPANWLYIIVLAVEIIGVIISNFDSGKMARALFATAIAQAFVPVIAFIFWRSSFESEIFIVLAANAFFVLLFASAGVLFLRSQGSQKMKIV